MHRFTIDYLTRNSGEYVSTNSTNQDAEIYVANHDGLLTSSGSNYLHTSLHLEDVYSVINNDVKSNVTSPLVVDSTYGTLPERETSTNGYRSTQNYVDLTATSIPDTDTELHTDVTPLASPSDVTYKHSVERRTPSPNKDSGIESDNSPVQGQDVEKTLRVLEKKAGKVKSSSSSTEKPSHSYIALIALAILDAPDRKSTLSDIYKFIMSNFPYYDNEEKAWRNSIRYNLSINECFIKSGKDEVGKGNLWAIHPACVEDFERGDYRRRQARRRARRNMKGPKSADIPSSEPAYEPIYQTMTPSYVAYHPYPNMGPMMHHQQRMAEFAHAYNGQSQVPSASNYSTTGRYQSQQYAQMLTMAGHEIPDIYTQQGYGVVPYRYESKVDSSSQGQYELDSKWYSSPALGGDSPDKENIPSNNNIVFS